MNLRVVSEGVEEAWKGRIPAITKAEEGTHSRQDEETTCAMERKRRRSCLCAALLCEMMLETALRPVKD